MNLQRFVWRVATGAVSLASLARAQVPLESGDVDHATAVTFVAQVVDLVETRALRPTDDAAYREAKERLLAMTRTESWTDNRIDTRIDTRIDRATLYQRTRDILWTLDTGGHTILWSKDQRLAFAASTPIARAAASDVVEGIDTPDGTVLVLKPPAAGSVDQADERAYAAALLANVAASPSTLHACALVVDLTAQTGGTAYPPLAVLGTLLSDANRSRLVDRDGIRSALAPIDTVHGNRRRLLPADASDPLGRFRGTAIAVIVGSETASAGETLDVMLMGEPDIRTFGAKTHGATTANIPVAIADEALLLLTTHRYALGDADPIRGGIEPDESVEPERVKASAAAWASARSRPCAATSAR